MARNNADLAHEIEELIKKYNKKPEKKIKKRDIIELFQQCEVIVAAKVDYSDCQIMGEFIENASLKPDVVKDGKRTRLMPVFTTFEQIPVEYMDNSGIVFKPKNLDTWKTIQTKSQGSLYDILSKIIYLETIPAKYNGTGYTIEFSSGTLEIGTEFTFSAENIIYKDKNGNIVNNICTSEYETEESNTVVVNAIVTSVSESTISIVTDLQTYSFKNSHIETSEDYSIINNNEEVIGTYNLSDYTVNEDLSCIPDYYINLDVIGNSIGAIGNLSGITDSIFGELTGNGIYCPENCTLINPNIAWPFLKISNTLAEVKVQDQLWITINRDLGKIETESYLIDSTGLIKTKSATFNVDGSLETKAFTISVDGDFETKAIVINSDGTVTIGDKSGTLQVDEDGILKLI